MNLDQPNQAEKQFREKVRALGSIISGRRTEIEIHHPAGRTAAQDGVPIGHWFLLPMTSEEHRLVDQGAMGLEELQMRFMGAHPDCMVWDLSLHEFEKFLYQRVIDRLDEKPDDLLINAIMNWSRQ